MAICGCGKCGRQMINGATYAFSCPYMDYSTNKPRETCGCNNPACVEAANRRITREAREMELRVLKRAQDRLDDEERKLRDNPPPKNWGW